MKKLKSAEEALLHKILNEGFSQVVDTFSEISQQVVEYQKLKIWWLPDSPRRPVRFFSDSAVHVLTTELIGDLAGISILVFNTSEVEKLKEFCLPPLGKGMESEELAHAMLLELDNMLSANVITHISNILGVKLYGDVPKLHIVSPPVAEEQITQELRNLEIDNESEWSMVVSVEISMKGSPSFSPRFVWKFNSEFIKSIQQHVVQTT